MSNESIENIKLKNAKHSITTGEVNECKTLSEIR
jgi:hypothetical protein